MKAQAVAIFPSHLILPSSSTVISTFHPILLSLLQVPPLQPELRPHKDFPLVLPLQNPESSYV